MKPYDASDNSRKSCELAIYELRIQCIRAGFVEPRQGHPDEVKAWEEGVRERAQSR